MGKKKREVLVKRINSLLGTKLELSRVSLEELKKLHDAISDRIGAATHGLLVGRNIQGLLDAPLVQVLKRRLSKKKLEDLTIRDFFSVLQEGAGEKGVLGLGVLPMLFRSGRRK